MQRLHRFVLGPRLALVSAALVSLACTAELSADLQVDDAAFQPTECFSGQRQGFAGVDLVDNTGRKLRLVQSPAMRPSAILIAGGQVIELGECGTMAFEQQNSTVNGIVNVRGEATLECAGQGHQLRGTLSFANCH